MVSPTRLVLRLLLAAFAAVALAGCETTGAGTTAPAAKAPEPPMTHTRAAELCWMSTEKGAASMALDKRADLVDKCIDEKMKGGSAGAAPAATAEDKKKKPADAKPKKPAAAADDKDQKDKKPTEADAPDKKP